MSKLTNEIYQKYANSLGPEQIASSKALRIIENFMDKFIKELGFDANNNVEPNIYIQTHCKIAKEQKQEGQLLKSVQELAPLQI